MYFKVHKESETGIKIQKIIDKKQACFDAAKQLVKELGAVRWRPSADWSNILGGISQVEFEEEPDPKVWKKEKGCYMEFSPRLTDKEGKKIQKKFNSLPVVKRKEYISIFGMTDITKTPGLIEGHGQFFFISFGLDLEYDMPEDVEEITGSQFKRLKSQISEDV